MGGIAEAVVEKLPEGALFAILVFDDPKVAQYVSNAQRADIIKALREGADRLEGGEDIPR